MTFKAPELTAARDAALEHYAATLNDSAFDVLPYVPAAWLEDAFQRHVPADLFLILRHKIVPISWMSPLVLHAVVNETALAEARMLGLVVVARISPESYRAAVRRYHGRHLIARAVHGFARAAPQMSARMRLSNGQAYTFMMLAAAAAGAWQFGGMPTLAFACSIAGMLFFTLVVAIRVFCVLPTSGGRAPAPQPLHDDELPVYTLLVPAFRETAILIQLVRALLAIDYPAEKLDIKLILEEDDVAMRRAVLDLALPATFDVLVVPAGKPRTKPRALNYGLQFARGTLVAIYDAEDIPHWQQLRKAAERFAAAPHDLACLQAALAFYNPRVNWLTRQFAAEYAALFKIILPVLSERGLPILLGGTSNHFRREALEAAGAWDPFNVTEDADLGIRLARLGYRCETLASETHEEANMEIGNWLKQRSRWLKGFLQTWLVHMRSPLALHRELGSNGFWIVQCMTLGVFGSALLHPFLLAIGIWRLLPANMTLLPNTVTAHFLSGSSAAILIAGYAVSMILAASGMSRQRLRPNWLVIFTLPLYWLLMSVAAWLALWDFAFRPFHWHKTRHGTSMAGENYIRPKRH